MGMQQQSLLSKRILYTISGFFLWLISFSLLHMSLIVLSVALLFLVSKSLKIKSFDFNLKDLCFVLAPFTILWAVFIGIYGESFIQNVVSSIQLMLSTRFHAIGSLTSINWEALKHIFITLIFCIAFLFSLNLSKITHLLASLIFLAVITFSTIHTSLFGLIAPYYRGWFSGPMWFSAFVASAYLLFLFHLVYKIFHKKKWDELELYALILFIPCMIESVSNIFFSTMGILAILLSSIPAIAAITCMVLSLESVKKRTPIVQLIILLLLLSPYYYITAWSDWKFTYFDVAPVEANVEIEEGFGKGIRTNIVYKDLYTWLITTSNRYSNENDYAISYIVSPMVHMITKRRPALDTTWISFGELPENYLNDMIAFMKNRKRNPKLAYVFEALPALAPISLSDNNHAWFNKEFSFPAGDPISRYIVANMTLVAVFQISNKLSVKCFIDNASVSSVLEKKRPIYF